VDWIQLAENRKKWQEVMDLQVPNGPECLLASAGLCFVVRLLTVYMLVKVISCFLMLKLNDDSGGGGGDDDDDDDDFRR
jgi:hypothetical protein